MSRYALSRQRRWFTLGLVTATLAGGYWWLFSAGLPVLWGPSASAAEVAAGRELFEHEWAPNDPLAGGDGLGPVFNAKSCAACHFQGGLGGGGELAHNAVNFEVLPRPADPNLHVGTVHNFSVDPAHKETFTALRRAYPVLRGETVAPPRNPGMPDCPPGGPTRTPDRDPLRTESVQTTALFGAGWIDRISEKAILYNARSRALKGAVSELAMDFGQIPVGAVRTLPDGRVGKFGWRGQFATLEEFVATACANEIGLGTELVSQPNPLADPTLPPQKPDLSRKQFRQLMAFVDTLPKPVEATPADPAERTAAARGKELFAQIGCAVCHVPDIGGVKGVYSDFLLYVLDDPHPVGGDGGGRYGPPPLPDRPRPKDLPPPEEWKTPPLWGVADSAPYFHDGGAATLQAAILRHRGDAKVVTEVYQKLGQADQQAVVSFLKTLKAPPNAAPLRDPAVTKLTRK